jgi:hypothetical protein
MMKHTSHRFSSSWRCGSELLADLVARRRLVILSISTPYSLETGEVEFFDAVPG